MPKMQILVGKYETKAGQKVRFGEIVEIPEEEAERAFLCNVAEYADGTGTPTKAPEPKPEEKKETSSTMKKGAGIKE